MAKVASATRDSGPAYVEVERSYLHLWLQRPAWDRYCDARSKAMRLYGRVETSVYREVET